MEDALLGPSLSQVCRRHSQKHASACLATLVHVVEYWSIIGIPETYRIYNNSCKYRGRHIGGVVGVIHAAYELMMLGTIQTTDDGKNDDGEEGDDDAMGQRTVLARNVNDIDWMNSLDDDGGRARGEETS
ncbi:hypothetical protein NPX13_g5656 [Xylaria arbuscula]|uniref:Uncharacterized protein n=1 Tax=Xylaria arbuscula TaxID=114810 RepID=A0A9W8TMY0_9PEZI|nr:hypothetical protein NPX13_g5656 [Xylaria arbuscula]